MRALLRKAACVLLAMFLVASGPGLSGWGLFGASMAHGQALPLPLPQTPGPDPRTVMDFLTANGVVQGPEDPLLKGNWIVDPKGQVTKVGATLYEYLKDRPKEAKELTPVLERMREAGEFTDKKREAVDAALRDFTTQYGDVAKASPGDAWALGALMNAIMTGAATAEPPRNNYLVFERGEKGYEFHDKDGLAISLNKNQVYVFNRDVAKAQRQLNQSRPSKAPWIPETGRYNYEMLLFSYYRLEEQLEALGNAARVDRVQRMAELLGEQLHQDMIIKDKDGALEKSLQGQKTMGGFTVSALVDRHLVQRWKYIEEGKSALKAYLARADQLKGREVITDGDVQAMRKNELLVGKYSTLVWVRTQMFHAHAQLERLGFEVVSVGGVEMIRPVPGFSPDSKVLRQAVKDSPLTDKEKENYVEAGRKLAAELFHLLNVYRRLEQNLLTLDASSQLDTTQAALVQTQKKLQDVSLDAGLHQGLPALAKVARDETASPDVPWVKPRIGIPFTDIGVSVKVPLPWLKDEVPSLTYHAARLGAALGWERARRYVQARQYLDRAEIDFDGRKTTRAEVLVGAARAAANGDSKAARQALIRMDPGAIEQNWTAPLAGTGSEITDAQRIQASLEHAQKELTLVAKAHMYTGIPIHILKWSAEMAVLSRIGGSVTKGFGDILAKGGGALRDAEKYGMALRTVGWGLEATGKTMQHVGQRLLDLGPAPGRLKDQGLVLNALKDMGVRGLNAGWKIGTFTALSGSISGVFTALLYAGENKPYDSRWEAFWDGMVSGAKWSTDEWHPLLALGIGLPSNIFEKTRAAPVVESLANRGLAGNLLAATEWLLGKGGSWAARRSFTGFARMGKWAEAAGKWSSEYLSLQKVAQWGKDGTGVLRRRGASAATQFVGLTDNVLKYAGFSHAMGWVEKHRSYSWNDRGWLWKVGERVDVEKPVAEGSLVMAGLREERRIKRALSDSMDNLQHGVNLFGILPFHVPLWIFLPMTPAGVEKDILAYQRSQRGFDQFKTENRLHELITAGKESELPLKGKDEVPILARIFNMRFFGESEATGTLKFTITEDLVRRAVQYELPFAAAGKRPGSMPLEALQVRAQEYYRISQLKDGQMVGGRFKANDVVRDEAYARFAETVVKDPKLAARVMVPASLGQVIDGFGPGRVRPRQQEDVALALYKAKAEGKLRSLPKRVEQLLEPYLVTERMVETQMKEVGQALAKNRGQDPAKVKRFQELVDGILVRTREWKDSSIAPKTGEKPPKYQALIEEFKAAADEALAKGLVAQPQRDALVEFMEALQAVDRRFQYFNKAGTASRRLLTSLTALMAEAEGKLEVAAALKKIEGSVRRWHDPDNPAGSAEKNADAPAAEFLRSMRKNVEKETQPLKKRLPPEDYAILEEALAEVEAAPWLLRDVKGTALPGWREVQFEALMETIASALKNSGDWAGAVGDTVHYHRAFVLLKTGGGKTLMSIEFLAPLLEVNGRKTLFLTVQSNLESQARMEFRSLRKVLSKLEFMTYEGFKTKVAEAKLKGKDIVEEYNYLEDEADGAAQQPILTVGERTASLFKDHGSFRRLETANTRLEKLIGPGGARDLGSIEFAAGKLKDAVEAVDGRSAHGQALRKVSTELERAVRQLRRAETKADLEAAAGRIEALLKGHEAVLDGGPVAPEAATALKLAAERMQAVSLELSQASGLSRIQEAAGRLEVAIKDGLRALAGQGSSPQGRVLSSMLESLRARAANVRSSTAEAQAKQGAGRMAGSVRDFLGRQEQALGGRGRAPEGPASEIRGSAKEVRTSMEALLRRQGHVEGFEPDGTFGQVWKLRWQAFRHRKDAAAAEQFKVQLEAAKEYRTMVKDVKALLKSQETALTYSRFDRHELVEWLSERTGRGMRERAAKAREEAQGLSAQDPKRAKLLELAERLEAGEAEAVRKAGGPEAVKKLEALAERVSAGERGWAKEIRDHFQKNGEYFLKDVLKREDGWRARARELLAERRSLFERVVDRKNPLYETYRAMKDAMEFMYWSTYRIQDDVQALGEAPASFAKGLRGTGDALVKEMQGLVSRMRELEAAGQGGPRARLMRAKAEEYLARAEAQKAAWDRGLDEVSAFFTEGTGSPKDAVLFAQLRQRQETFRQASQRMESAAGEAHRLEVELAAARKAPDAKPETTLPIETKLKAARELHDAAQKEAKETLLLMDENIQGLRPALKQALQTAGERFAAETAQWHESLGRLAEQPEFAEAAAAAHVQRARASLDADVSRWQGQIRRQVGGKDENGVKHLGTLDMTSQKTVEILERRLEALSREFSRRLAKDIWLDPYLTESQRWELFWRVAPGGLPKAFLPSVKGSFVYTELLNLARGHADNPNSIRMDNTSGRTNAVHIGQWFESMDTPTRRFWELHYGTDLTWPYSHRTKATFNDILSHRKVSIIAFSGTAEGKFKSYIAKELDVVGAGSGLPKDVAVRVVETASQKYMALGQTMREIRAWDAARVAEGGQANGVMVIPVPGIREGKIVKQYLLRTGLITQGELVNIFSDAEFLRTNRSQANVLEQMNTKALNDGTAKVVILDIRVAGRGLDLNFRGNRGNASLGSFEGYRYVKEMILDPQFMSPDTKKQVFGRTDLGTRVDASARMVYEMILDIKTAERDPFFQDMVRRHPFFASMSRAPEVAALARQKGLASPDWQTVHEHILKKGDDVLSARYKKALEEYLSEKQEEVGGDQMRSSGILNDHPAFNRLLHGIEAVGGH